MRSQQGQEPLHVPDPPGVLQGYSTLVLRLSNHLRPYPSIIWIQGEGYFTRKHLTGVLHVPGIQGELRGLVEMCGMTMTVF